ncbi:LPS translocon maturation chaperone LptM [Solilutibacter silvestris]|uniref:Prokaryotic lipoprotein-attachment site n=1 Tax=Solilutibacter silvestris TaxID=1645665 RepID=A0A2K1Q0H9_9GAMM|nr:lipoprotein [Lysobacter silvestris]PNS08427.1 Prokaryotic lipoprotein-attachment site [Lysobacter silvestris]
MNIKLPLVLVAACLLAACGNKGPLVMPQKPVPVETTTPALPADTQSQPTDSQSQPKPAAQPAQEPPATPAPKH